MAGIPADSGWQARRRGKRQGLGQNGRRDDGYREQRVPPDRRTRRAGDRCRLRGPLPTALPARPPRTVREGAGGGRRRHLVLEPLSRRVVRFRKPWLLVHLFPRADARGKRNKKVAVAVVMICSPITGTLEEPCIMDYELRILVEKVAISSQEVIKRDT